MSDKKRLIRHSIRANYGQCRSVRALTQQLHSKQCVSFFFLLKKFYYFFFVLNFIAQYSYLVRLVVIFLKLCVLFMLEIKLNKLNLFDQTLLHVYKTER